MVSTSRHQCHCTTMIRVDCLLVLAAILQVITSQGPPYGPRNHKCAGPPPGVQHPETCCPVDPLFTEEELTECGFQKMEPGERQRGLPGPPDCSKQECLLQKRDLLADDKSIKYPEVTKYLDDYANSHEDFKSVIENAKANCMGDGGPPGPTQICEADRLMFCIGTTIFTDCPIWQNTDECKLLKEHMNECRNPRLPPS